MTMTPSAQAERDAVVARWKADPAAFLQEFMGLELQPWQVDAIREIIRGNRTPKGDPT